jgi:hypothetical protein
VWCSFGICLDLFLGPLSGYPDVSTYTLYQLDRVDSNRHYTIDNVRWIDKANNIVNQPAGKDDWLHLPVCQKEAETVAKSIELRRHIRGLTKSTGTLAKEVS